LILIAYIVLVILKIYLSILWFSCKSVAVTHISEICVCFGRITRQFQAKSVSVF